MEKNKMFAGGLLLGAGALIANELGMFGDKDNGDIPPQTRQRAGGILGSGAGVTPGTVFNIPASAGVTFPKVPSYDLGRIFTPTPTGVVEAQDKPSASRGGAGDFAYAESIFMGADVVTPTKKTPYEPSLLQIAPAGVAAKGAIQAAAGVEAQRISRAGVAGGGAITSFLKDVGGFAVSTPSRIGRAGVASGRAIGSAARGVTGISKKQKKTSTGTFASKSYQKGYKARASARHATARKARMSKKENKSSSSGGGDSKK